MTIFFTYIGKPRAFLPPAYKFGVSRRCPANVAKTMAFGDRVICLDWRGGRPAAFAEFRVNGVYFDSNVHVGKKLMEQGRCEQTSGDAGSGGPVHVVRECGEFTIGASHSLKDDVTLAEIIEFAEDEIKEKGGSIHDLWCMIGGTITKEYKPPMTVLPTPSFMRGFMRVPSGTRIGDEPMTDADAAPNQIVLVKNYEKNMD